MENMITSTGTNSTEFTSPQSTTFSRLRVGPGLMEQLRNHEEYRHRPINLEELERYLMDIFYGISDPNTDKKITPINFEGYEWK